MIAGGIFTGVSNLFNSPLDNRFSFVIYDNRAITLSTTAERQAYKLLAFDGFINLNYENDVVIPQQSLENRDFSNDSIIDNPFRLSITAIISQQISSITNAYADYNGSIVKTVENLGKSNTLLAIFRTAPLFSAYTNMHLEHWQYEQSPDRINLTIILNFKEIRTNYVPNDNTNQNIIDGVDNSDSFSATNSNNPGNISTTDNGIINSISPTGDTSTLQLSTEKVLN